MTHIVRMADGTVLSKHDVKNFPEFDELKQMQRDRGFADSPLMALCYKWLKEDAKRPIGYAKTHVEEETGMPHSRWDELKDINKYGDKYYDYWK